jgi:catechol 2,3-dioxygenase
MRVNTQGWENLMPVPTHVFDPPFNIIRSSHVVLDVTDLKASRDFYETTVGLHVEDADDSAVYLRGSEEHQHHSLVLRKAQTAACNRLGFKVANDGDLDKAASFFSENGVQYKFAEQPFQGRTLQFTDPFGFQIELYATMEKRPHLLRRYDLYRGCHPQRLDHFNIFAAEVQDTMDFYARIGFRLTEYAEEDGPNGRIAAAWLHRKGNVHDLAITNGKGPRLHHFCYWVPTAMNVLHLCDVMAASGFLKNLERGPGRHGISNAFFLYVRDPDGHRLELYTSDYFTGDHDHEPLRWSLNDPRRQTLWGAPAPRSWFEQGSPFAGSKVREPAFAAQVTIAD